MIMRKKVNNLMHASTQEPRQQELCCNKAGPAPARFLEVVTHFIQISYYSLQQLSTWEFGYWLTTKFECCRKLILSSCAHREPAASLCPLQGGMTCASQIISYTEIIITKKVEIYKISSYMRLLNATRM